MRIALLAMLLALASCGDDDCCEVASDAAGMPDASDGRVEVARVTPARDVDMLFVVDDSPSTLDKQTALTQAFPAFVNELASLPGGLPSIHIGVITSDLGTKASEDALPGPAIGSGVGSCSGTGAGGVLTTNNSIMINGNYISDLDAGDGTRTRNYTGSLSEAFTAAASVGSNGCGFEQPLEAARLALENNPSNADFVRVDAALAVIVVTDEDDCSAAHTTLFAADTSTLGPLNSFRCTQFGVQCDVGGSTPEAMGEIGTKEQCHSNESGTYLTKIGDYAPFLRSLKANPDDVMFAALLGDVTPVTIEPREPPGGGATVTALAHSCAWQGASGPAVADPGVRVAQLASQFTRNTVASICSADLAEPLVSIARQVRGLAGDACLSQAIAQPPDCIVTDELGSTMTPIPACSNEVTTDCYAIVTDTASCSAGAHLALQVTRSQPAAPGTVTVARCRL